MRPVRKIAKHGAALESVRALIAAGHVGTAVDFQRSAGTKERAARTALSALMQAGEAKHLRNTSYTTPRASCTLSAAVYGPAGAATDAPITLRGLA